MNGSRGLEGVHGTINAFDLECARLQEPSKPSDKRGCSDGVWGGG